MEEMLVSHFRSWEIVIPRNLKIFTVDTGRSDMVRWSSVEGCLLKSTIISTVLSMFSSRLFLLHQSTSGPAYCRYLQKDIKERNRQVTCIEVGRRGDNVISHEIKWQE